MQHNLTKISIISYISLLIPESQVLTQNLDLVCFIMLSLRAGFSFVLQTKDQATVKCEKCHSWR